jgi:mRNA interferase MazF
VGRFVKGDVVVIPFPFSDLSGSKRRPALVIAALPGEDSILCQITSRHKTDPLALSLEAADFTAGGLPMNSFIRPNKLFTADSKLILSVAGHITDAKIHDVVSVIVALISR